MKAVVGLLDRVTGVIALVSAWAAMAIMLGITLLILAEVVLRSFFRSSTQILEEFVGYGLGAMIFLGLAQALRAGSLVRVDIVLGRLGPVWRRWVEMALCCVTIGVMLFLIRFLYISVERSYLRGTISMTRAATPVWIPEALILLGMGIFTFTLVVYLLRLMVGGPLVPDSGGRE